MTGRKWIGIATALATLGLAAPAFAQEYYPDDHQMFHQDQREEHQLQHEELDAEHQAEHMREAQEHARMHAEGWGDDPFSHWMMHRRLSREHRREHLREWYQHAQEHADGEAEHYQYHRQTDPYNYGGGYYYSPQYRSYRYYR
jgi:hypothetical protein